MLLRLLMGSLVLALSACSDSEEDTKGAQTTVSGTPGATEFTVVELATGLEHPWGLAFLPDGRILITERTGSLRVFDPAEGLQEPVSGLPQIAVVGQGGLLDVALHPDHAKNGWIYISYAAEEDGRYGTEVARGKLLDNQLHELEVIFVAEPKVDGGNHFGSRLVFDNDGHLFVTLGDRGKMDPAQDLSNHIGTIVRLHDDGTVPQDNPFVGQSDIKPEIYSYGHRNVQGAALNPATGELWTHEHGPQGGDEINLPKPGVNYGWPVITFGVNYGTGTKIGEGITSKEGMTQPLYYWVPSIAPSGMTFYDGDKFPDWQGNLLVGALSYQLLARLELEDGEVVHEERLLEKDLGRIRALAQGPDGYIYLLTDARNGKLVRLEPASP